MAMRAGRLAGLALTALKSNVSELKRPYKLNFCVTYRCQSRCKTCDIWKMRPEGELSIDEVRSVAGKNSYLKWIELTGGEVFLRSDIVEVARAFSTSCRGLYVLTMPTNSLCNLETVRNRLEGILSLGIPRVVVTVSLDGHRELHDSIRGIPGNYDRAIAMFRMLGELKAKYDSLSFVFGYTISRFNQGQLERTFQEVKGDLPWITHNDFHVNLAQTSDNYYNNSGLAISPDPMEVRKDLSFLLSGRRFSADPMNVVEDAFLSNLVKFSVTGKTPVRGRSLEASLFLDSFGNVYPSIMWDEKLGNVRDTGYDFVPILASQRSIALRSMRSVVEPEQWTSCEAYQSLAGNIKALIAKRSARRYGVRDKVGLTE